MANLYHFTVGMSLVIFVTGQTPFTLNATTDQQMAASDNDLLFNITQLFANRTEPVLLDEEGLSSHLTSPIIQLTASQKQELAQNFGPLLSPMAMDAFTELLCPTTNDGRLILYVTLEQDGCLLQLITEIRFGGCRDRNPPGSCLDPRSAASLRCHCCVRYRTVVVLAVKVSSCSTGSCQLILVRILVPYCTCCQDPILNATSTDATELTTTPTKLATATTELTTTSTKLATATTELTTTPTKLTTATTELTKTPTHSTSTTPSYRTTQRSTNWPSQSTRRSTTSATSSAQSTVRHTTQRILTSKQTTNCICD
ncbi:hypothetical protein HOLleu_31629 [Holothuria leucospilota]|uniref:Uncharacterized protein n=1 Tax=Holothuria leucospilota TaxID=206669 RepID=A0A9Q0YTB2_HOLLE|nr:hypothetical protein HOLleu_31629 [Holothuria leucospilota]